MLLKYCFDAFISYKKYICKNCVIVKQVWNSNGSLY